ncbi:Gfo/Idh/MocA family protein [Tranquillimonas alkanivorans]|uniref:D-galactose 1-dehydrogenase n=1 Tax=Tranquillimonas alkanivorans TaxID=441119 RepID=A0A1I5QTV6_9RHOB|nr:Gfo/Idh/MocA family oxidoreductase [Tranquillimonas alkanivorans]SFP49653.1 D-galactose 1-dehydrogenase [Tranquillimonas alkanivorans]
MAEPLSVALVGIGKIARDQHIPALNADPDWTLAATVSRSGGVDGVENFADLPQMLEARPDIGVVSLAVPPVPRFAMAAAAIGAGRHVMLEKPPGATLAECHALSAQAQAAGVTLHATWHSRMAHGVAAAKEWLAERELKRLRVTWKEDVRRWHPGQEWIWQAGGLGVFDPGINALSILTEILPAPVHLSRAVLDFPGNRDTPIAAELDFAHPGGAEVSAVFDWRQEGPQTWDIEAETDAGTMRLSDGGATFRAEGAAPVEGPDREYPRLYARMAELVRAGTSEVDLAPMVHVADAFTLGRRRVVEPFDW